jgi:hypothetical protein
MKLNVGIVVVGSLFWDDDLPHRRDWRRSRLLMDKAIGVKVPIRYGRRSSSRGNTYTMVFSPDCELGQAKAVQCAHSVSCVEELIEEAECLWAAEQPSEPAPGRKRLLSANWGCVSLLPHPQLLQSPSKDLREVLDGWTTRVALEANYDGKNYDGPDGRCLVDKKGFLQISWPNVTDSSEPLSFDVMLATATQATRGDYPSASVVAQAWKTDKEGNDKYFWRNREHGITTFQDAEILSYLQAQ